MNSTYISEEYKDPLTKAREAKQRIKEYNHLLEFCPLPVWYVVKEIGKDSNRNYVIGLIKGGIRAGFLELYRRNDGEVMITRKEDGKNE